MFEGESPIATAHMLLLARNGDEQARCDIVQRYREPLARFLRKRLASSLRGVEETADFVQETLSAAVRQLDRFEYRGMDSFWGYLRRIGLNLIGQASRRHAPPVAAGRALRTVPVLVAHEPPPLQEMMHAELQLALEDALQHLPGAQRAAVLLRVEIQRPYKVIARECGYPSADAARMAVRRALARLAKGLASFAP